MASRRREERGYVVAGVADIRDAVIMICLEECEMARPCLRLGCALFSWCPKASTSLPADLNWIRRADARKRKIAARAAARRREVTK